MKEDTEACELPAAILRSWAVRSPLTYNAQAVKTLFPFAYRIASSRFACLRNACLRYVCLRDAYLRDASLRYACLCFASLCDACLHDGYLHRLLRIDAFLISLILFQLLSIEFCHLYIPPYRFACYFVVHQIHMQYAMLPKLPCESYISTPDRRLP